MSKEIKENQNQEYFTPVPKKILKEIKLKPELLIFYSYICRYQAMKNSKTNETNNSFKVSEISSKLNLKPQTAKKYLDDLVEIGLVYHNSKDSKYSNTYQALFYNNNSKYENGKWSKLIIRGEDSFKEELDGDGELKYLTAGYTLNREGGFTMISDEILLSKELTWNEKVWWCIFRIVDETYNTYAYNSINTTFGLNMSNGQFADKIENLKNKGFVKTFKTTKKGIKIEVSETKVGTAIVERKTTEETAMKMFEEVKSVEEQVEEDNEEEVYNYDVNIEEVIKQMIEENKKSNATSEVMEKIKREREEGKKRNAENLIK